MPPKTPPPTLLNHWQHILDKRAEDIAVTDFLKGTQSTFADIDQQAKALVKQYELERFQGQLIAFQEPNSASWLALLIAIRYARAIALPMDITMPQEHTQACLRALRCACLVSENEIMLLEGGWHDHTLSYVKLTSGSTGQAKPICFTDNQILADARNVMQSMDVSPSDINYATIPFGHSYGLGNITIPLIAYGVSCVITSGLFPSVILEEIKNSQATVFPTTPHILKGLSRVDASDAAQLNTLRKIISAAAPLPSELARQFYQTFDKPILNFYGSTETGGIAFDPTGECGLSGEAIGWPLIGVALELDQDERLKISSDAVFTHDNHNLKHSQGCFTLPDRVSIMDNGSLKLLGRTDRIVKVSGKKINLEAIELELTNYKGINDSAVSFDLDNNKVNILYTGNIPAHELKSWLGRTVLPTKIPLRVRQVKQIPRTPRGKIDYNAFKK